MRCARLLAFHALFGGLTLGLLAACRAPQSSSIESSATATVTPAAEVEILAVPGEDPRLVAARRIMASTRHCALITVDDVGRPRARTVDPRPPDESMVIYVVTQPLTRKVKQIEMNP